MIFCLLVFHCNVSVWHHFQDIINYFPQFKEVTWPWWCPLEGLFHQSDG